MNKSPNLPGAIEPGAHYSFRMDWRVNAWMYGAMACSLITDLFYRAQVRTWPDSWRALAALAPLIAVLFWIRQLARWIHGMDELHRSITRAACLFATAATFFVIAAWHHLSRLGILEFVFPGQMKAYAGIDLHVPWLILWLLLIAYLAGQRIFMRRFV